MQKISVAELVELAEDSLHYLEIHCPDSIVGVSPYLAYPRKRDPYFGWRYISTSDDFRLRLRNVFSQKVCEYSTASVSSMEFDAVTDDNLGVLPASDFYQFSEGMDRIPSPTSPNATFKGETDFLHRAKWFAIELDLSSGEKITCFQSVGSNFVTKSQSTAFWRGDEVYFESAGEHLVSFPETIAFFEFRNLIFVAEERRFTSMTKFDNVIKDVALEALDHLQTVPDLDFENPEKIREILEGSVEFMRRLASAYKAGSLHDRNVSEMQKDIEEYTLNISCEMKNDILHLKPELGTRKGRRDFVDVLSDRITASRSSGIAYRMQKGTPLLST